MCTCRLYFNSLLLSDVWDYPWPCCLAVIPDLNNTQLIRCYTQTFTYLLFYLSLHTLPSLPRVCYSCHPGKLMLRAANLISREDTCEVTSGQGNEIAFSFNLLFLTSVPRTVLCWNCCLTNVKTLEFLCPESFLHAADREWNRKWYSWLMHMGGDEICCLQEQQFSSFLLSPS